MKTMLRIGIIIALVLVVSLVFTAFVACHESTAKPNDGRETKTEEQPANVKQDIVIDAYTSGKDITWDVVNEDENGLPYLNVNGTKYELGMEFLANAMVFNSQDSAGLTKDEVFKKWYEWYNRRADSQQVAIGSGFKLYAAYRDVNGFEEHPLATYRGWEQVKYWSPVEGDTLDLFAGIGAAQYWNTPTSGWDWQSLIVGHGLLKTDDEGRISFNDDVVASHTNTINEAGKRQVTVTIREGMRFSDGTPITAGHYLGKLLVCSSPIYAYGEKLYTNIAEKLDGYDVFAVANGQTVFSGIKMTDDYTMVFTYDAAYTDYYWVEEILNLYPYPDEIFLGDHQIVVSDAGLALPDAAYAKDEEGNYVLRDVIRAHNSDPSFATSGMYRIAEKHDGLNLIPNDEDSGLYKIHLCSSAYGHCHVVAVSGYNNFEHNKMKYIEITPYAYGDLLRVRTIGPLKSSAVRNALAKAFDWERISENYKICDTLNHSYRLNQYWAGDVSVSAMTTDIDGAIALLESDGWLYNADGTLYNKENGGVRYKKTKELTEQDTAYYNKAKGNLVSTGEPLTPVYLEAEACYLIPLTVRVCAAVGAITWDCLPNGNTIGMRIEEFQQQFNIVIEDYYDEAGVCALYSIGDTLTTAYDVRGRFPVFTDEADVILVY